MSSPQSGDLHQLVGEMFLEVKALRSEVQQLRSEVAGKATQSEGWAIANDAAAALKTEGVHDARHLQRLRLEGAFSESQGEIQDMSPGARPTWQYHVPKCKMALRRHFKRVKG